MCVCNFESLGRVATCTNHKSNKNCYTPGTDFKLSCFSRFRWRPEAYDDMQLSLRLGADPAPLTFFVATEPL